MEECNQVAWHPDFVTSKMASLLDTLISRPATEQKVALVTGSTVRYGFKIKI